MPPAKGAFNQSVFGQKHEAFLLIASQHRLQVAFSAFDLLAIIKTTLPFYVGAFDTLQTRCVGSESEFAVAHRKRRIRVEIRDVRVVARDKSVSVYRWHFGSLGVPGDTECGIQREKCGARGQFHL